MTLDSLIAAITPEVYQRLSQAVELGKWPDGVALTTEQKENSLQIVMLWQARHNQDAQHMSIGSDGKIVMKSKQALIQQFINPAPVCVMASNARGRHSLPHLPTG